MQPPSSIWVSIISGHPYRKTHLSPLFLASIPPLPSLDGKRAGAFDRTVGPHGMPCLWLCRAPPSLLPVVFPQQGNPAKSLLNGTPCAAVTNTGPSLAKLQHRRLRFELVGYPFFFFSLHVSDGLTPLNPPNFGGGVPQEKFFGLGNDLCFFS